jgi:hypothetical protein
VEGVRLVEDTSSVAYRYRNGVVPQRPNVARRASPGEPAEVTQRQPATYAYDFPSDFDGDDEPYYEEASPFAEEEPEWLAERIAPADTRPVVAEPARQELEMTETADQQSVAPDGATPTAPESPEPRKRTARIIFRRSRSLDADRRRLLELVQTLSGFAGEDRFEIVVESNGAERYQLDFPNNHTRICRELKTILDQRLGPGAWSVVE